MTEFMVIVAPVTVIVRAAVKRAEYGLALITALPDAVRRKS